MKKHHYVAWIAVALVAWYFRAQILAAAANLFTASKSALGSSTVSQGAGTPASTLAAAVDSTLFMVGNPSTPGPVQHLPQNDPLYLAGLNETDPFFQNQRIGTQGNVLDPLDAQFKLIGGGYGGGVSPFGAQNYFRTF